jgi:hypothetical protein
MLIASPSRLADLSLVCSTGTVRNGQFVEIGLIKTHHVFRKGDSVVVRQTTSEIVQQSEKYFDAISASIELAKTGRIFADQATVILQRLSQNTISPRELRKYVSSLLKIAVKASDRSQAAEQKFGEVRIGLIQVV